ncbi:DnaJ domain-containing protein (plasmid) [Sulfitobacter sp. S223]|uniref:DnaJ domain-containing protein n=1 Tax=Sulfitobacter sp. S223 TaxID=2867023 RepID=UPI0021A76F50|nr:DnaJ domain-containing protein [Sulfitobacter sp. S223]UWR28311.1 DnaJ domain-containing protein [Sulfitobacter sp. S223]
MIEFIEVMFRALTGLKLTFPNIISLAVFFAAGYYFAATTKRIGPLKMIFVLFLAYLLSTLLSGLLGVYTLAVVLGFLSNQSVFLTRVLLWVESLTEFLFVMRHRAAYEDIRREESAGQDHGSQETPRPPRNKTQADRREQTGDKSQSESREQKSESSNWKPGRRKSQADIDHCLRILELEMGKAYTQKDIKKAYRRLAMVHHPDLPTGNQDAFVNIGMAKDYLMKHVAV